MISLRFESHAGSKQCVFGLVAAGFGITLATTSRRKLCSRASSIC